MNFRPSHVLANAHFMLLPYLTTVTRCEKISINSLNPIYFLMVKVMYLNLL